MSDFFDNLLATVKAVEDPAAGRRQALRGFAQEVAAFASNPDAVDELLAEWVKRHPELPAADAPAAPPAGSQPAQDPVSRILGRRARQ